MSQKRSSRGGLTEKADSQLPLIKVLQDAKMTVHVLADDTDIWKPPESRLSCLICTIVFFCSLVLYLLIIANAIDALWILRVTGC